MNSLSNPTGYGFRLASALLFVGLSLHPACAQRQRAGGNPFQPPQATIHYARDREYHVRHLRLVFDIDSKKLSATGVVTHYLSPILESLKVVTLDAGANLKINGCRVNNASASFVHLKNKLYVTAPTPLTPGKEATVEISYLMPGDSTGGGANGIGGFHWIKTSPDDPDRRPGFWTQGETGTNSNWIPCYDYPNDKCTSETIVTVPDNWEVVGNGTQGATLHDDAKHTRTFHWTMKQPHSTYLLSLVGGELDIRKASWAGVPLYYVVPRGRADLIPTSFGNTPDMLQWFSDNLGVKYPWPKYAQNAMIDFGGGMENVSATTLGANSLTDGRAGHYPMSSLNSHELAHQWFGDFVTCKDWGDIWLNESFATFFEMFYMEHLDGKDRYDQERDNSLHSYLFEAQRYKRPLSTKLYRDPDVMFDSHTYPKGGLILHMLRRLLGDKGFFAGLHHYLTVNAYKPVDSHDLSKAFEEATGRNVEPFFDQWIYKPGHPVLDSTWTYDEGGKAVVLKVKQTQDTSDGTPVYSLPLTVALLRQSSGSVVERQTVTLDKADQEFRLLAATKPDAVLVDPDHDLLKEVKDSHWAGAELPVILRGAPCVLDRVEAVNQLGKGTLSDATIQLFTEAVRSDNSEASAAAMLAKLGETKKESLRALFHEQAQSKQSGRRAAALQALGNLPRNEEDMKLLHAAAISDTEPYNVVAAAMRALGKLDAAGNLDVFKHQIASRSQFDQLASVAITTLGEAKLDAAAPLIIEATTPAHRPFVRFAAVRALATMAPGNADVRAALIALLKEPDNPRLTTQAIRALRTRKEKEAVPALRDLAKTAKNAEIRDSAKDAADEIEGK